jgi:hypothetical protein
MFQSQLPALSCDEKTWDKIANDYSYWRKIPEAEYDDWVDLCEELDKQIESCLSGDCFVIGDITYWRERAVEISVAELSDKRLLSLQRLLKARFSDWRIVLHVWSDLDEGVHVGKLLIGCELFAITRDLARYFPIAEVKK